MSGKSFLGRGPRFPFALGVDGRLAYAEEEEKVQQSILLILGTARGERVMRPTFGSRLHELVFAPISASTRARVSQYVTEALTTWEPRIDLIDVAVTVDPATTGKLLVDIEYRVRATNSTFNLVYPFYTREGVDGGTPA